MRPLDLLFLILLNYLRGVYLDQTRSKLAVNWTKIISEKLDRIQYNGQVLIGINPSGSILMTKARLLQNPNWATFTKIPGKSIRTGVLWGETLIALEKNEGRVYYSSIHSPNWIQKSSTASLTEISVNKDRMVGCNLNGEIYTQIKDSGWKRVSEGILRQAVISGSFIVGTNFMQDIYAAEVGPNEHFSPISWFRVLTDMRKFKQVDYDGLFLVGIDEIGQVWAAHAKGTIPRNPNWILLPGIILKHISVSRGNLFGLDSTGYIYFCDLNEVPIL